MHREILTDSQNKLLPLIQAFGREFYLVGGTAIALFIGHRHSIDFDLFTEKDIKRIRIKRNIDKYHFDNVSVLYEAYDQIHLLINEVKLTFFNFPYKIEPQIWFENIIQMPTLLDLAAMKVFSLGGRAKWKDYVDLYFLFKHHFTFRQVTERAQQIFGSYFNEKLLREQLSYYQDIDYSESINYLNKIINIDEIKIFLTDLAFTTF